MLLSTGNEAVRERYRERRLVGTPPDPSDVQEVLEIREHSYFCSKLALIATGRLPVRIRTRLAFVKQPSLPKPNPDRESSLLAVLQGGSLGRVVPHVGRLPTIPVGDGQSLVLSRDALEIPRYPADGPVSSRCHSQPGLRLKRRGFDDA